MKLNKILYVCMLGIMALTSCEKEPIVLEFDDSYTPKAPDKGDRDPMPPVDLLTLYTYFADNQPDIIINRTIDGDDGSLSVEDIEDREIIIKTSIPADIDTHIELLPMTDENSDGQYSTIVKGLNLELPADAYSLSTQNVTISQGERQAQLSIRFNKEKFLELDHTRVYVLPLVMKADNSEAKIVNNYTLYIHLLDVKKLPHGNNVEAPYSISGNIVAKSNLTFSSDFASAHVYKLNDGNTWQNWWVNGLSNSYLLINWKNGSSVVKALSFTTDDYWKRMKSVKVWASQDGGITFIEQGTVDLTPSDSSNPVCAFKTPITINALKLTDFVSVNDNGAGTINIYEIDLYEGDE